MKFLLALGVIAVIVFAVLKMKPKGGNRKNRDKQSRKRVGHVAAGSGQSAFSATTIVPGKNACQAARELQGKLFLDSELNVPKLPLPECIQVHDCHCRYSHQGDRRSDEGDRRAHTLETELYPVAEGEDRREPKRGRRSTD